jgi:class 3 adenylate cyclase|tara:strand:- start:202 stop:1248 length:1047 start_codon:yes stop_codon:yes gene_type:complete
VKEKSESLLVVEDEAFNRTLIKRHLDAEGYENVTFAENGREALELVDNNTFDLILLDIEMPELDGFGVLKELKADLNHRHIPVIMISGVDDIESIVACIELGAEDFLPKPFNPALLRARLGASLEKKRLRDQETSYVDQIKTEKKRADGLLSVILPSTVASELKATGKVQPRSYDDVALLFCDIVEFTAYSVAHSAEEVVDNLQRLFTKFEQICVAHGLEKIKTIGDEFMAAAGLTQSDPEPLLTAVKGGLDMLQAAPQINPDWQVRVGVHSGPVVAGIVGDQKYQFDVWGDTVNMAARMAGAGNPGSVTMTHDSWLHVQTECQGKSLGNIAVKGKGDIDLVEINGLK